MPSLLHQRRKRALTHLSKRVSLCERLPFSLQIPLLSLVIFFQTPRPHQSFAPSHSLDNSSSNKSHFRSKLFTVPHFLGVAAHYSPLICLTLVKLNPNKTSSRRKMRKAHFAASSVERRVRMSSALSKELSAKYHVST